MFPVLVDTFFHSTASLITVVLNILLVVTSFPSQIPFSLQSLLLDLSPSFFLLNRNILSIRFLRQRKGIDKVGFRQRFQLTNYRFSIKSKSDCLGNHLIPPPPTYLPTHINFTLLFLSSLWSDLGMWGHYLIVLSLRNSNFTSARATERGIAH